MYKLKFLLENEIHKILWNFEIQMDPLVPARRPDLELIHKKKRTCQLVDFAIPANYRVQMIENPKQNKKQSCQRVEKAMEHETEKPIAASVLGTVSKVLEKSQWELEIIGRIETIQTTALLKSAKLLRLLKTWGDKMRFWLQLKLV